MNLSWVSQFNENEVKQIHSLMLGEWWCSKRRLSEVHKVIDGSNVVLGAVDENGDVVGFCRVLTDYIFKAMIFDVIIEPSFRNTGLGREMISRILADDALNEVKSFELYCAEEMTGYYKKLGFVEYQSKLLGYKN